MSSNGNNKNHLAEYLSFESSRKSQKQSNNNNDITRHALNQLIESKLGTEITWCAQRLAATKNSGSTNNNGGNKLMEEEVVRLMETSAYQQTITTQIQQCPLSLLLPTKPAQHVTNNDVNIKDHNIESSNAASSNTKPSAAVVAPMSFSLFDLMDSQQLSNLPPRIMACQIIDAYHRDCKTNNGGNNSSGGSNNNSNINSCSGGNNIPQKTALELLEEANDMEDLSPDVDSWEAIRCIIYHGLIVGANGSTATNSSSNNNSSSSNNNKNNIVKEQHRRYFNVNKSLFNKCIKGGTNNGGGSGAIMMLRCQTWGLTYNIIGSILYQSLYLVTCQQDTNYGVNNNNNSNNNSSNNSIDLDLYWDSHYHLLTSLSQLSKEYITSCIGYETEIERMIMGLSYILCTDISSCVMAMMEPMVGYFEIWSRFVKPDRLLSILRVTRLGEIMLHRCECRGQNESTKRLHEMIMLHHCQERGDDETTACSTSTTTLQDLENANFIQSLSILRVILFRCNVTSSERMWSIFATGNDVSATTTASSFLMADGIVSSDEVQSMLNKAKGHEQEDSTEQSQKDDVRTRLLKPFCDVIRLSKSNPDLVSDDLEMLCTQTVSLIEKL
jgi:hypothetical protein